jgi:hypothetical protein
VKRTRIDLIVAFVLLTIVLGALALGLPGDRNLLFHIYVLALGTVVMWSLVTEFGAIVPRSRRSQLTSALNAPAAPRADVAELARMQRAVTLGVGNASDFHTRLLPILRDVAWTKLERQGRRPGPETLGEWWELLRPDAPPPEDRFAPGIRRERLRSLVHDLERM